VSSLSSSALQANHAFVICIFDMFVIFFLVIGLVCVMKLFVGKVKFIVGGIVIASVRNVSVLSIIAFIVGVDLVCLIFSVLLLVAGVVSALGVAVVLVSIVLLVSILFVVVSVSVLVSSPLAVLVTGSASRVTTVTSTLTMVRVSIILFNVMTFVAVLSTISLLTVVLSLD
jgi:hypothetical protein